MITFKELGVNNYLGSFDELNTLISIIKSHQFNNQELEYFCKDKPLLFRKGIKSLIQFLFFLEIIKYKTDVIHINYDKFPKLKLETNKEFLSKIIINKLIQTQEFQYLVNSFYYDSLNNLYTVKSYDIPLSYHNLKNLLINLGFWKPDPFIKANLIISYLFIDIIEKALGPLNKKKLSYEDFLHFQELKRINGEIAESFVLKYEQQRLAEHRNLSLIKIISKINVNAGYDIQSFESLTSTKIDKFIEVKSITNNYFYWSRNEINSAKELLDNYYLYLVSLNSINENNYKPNIIRNPYINLFQNPAWLKEEENWKIKILE